MMRGRWQWIIVTGLGVVLALAALFVVVLARQPLRIAWHRHEMQRAWNESEAAQDPNESYARFESHLEALVQLGAVTKRDYHCSHLRIPTAESRHLWRNIMAKDCPPLLNASAEFPKTPEPMVLEVWCEHEFRDEWDQFLKDRDVPDYQQRWMSPSSPADDAGRAKSGDG